MMLRHLAWISGGCILILAAILEIGACADIHFSPQFCIVLRPPPGCKGNTFFKPGISYSVVVKGLGREVGPGNYVDIEATLWEERAGSVFRAGNHYLQHSYGWRGPIIKTKERAGYKLIELVDGMRLGEIRRFYLDVDLDGDRTSALAITKSGVRQIVDLRLEAVLH